MLEGSHAVVVLREVPTLQEVPAHHCVAWGSLSLLPAHPQVWQTPSISGDQAHPRPALWWQWDGGPHCCSMALQGAQGHLTSLLN